MSREEAICPNGAAQAKQRQQDHSFVRVAGFQHSAVQSNVDSNSVLLHYDGGDNAVEPRMATGSSHIRRAVGALARRQFTNHV